MIERLTTITELPVSEIGIEGRLREVSPSGVATLVEAIRENGFVGRITVRRKKDGDYVLDGAHRLTAMRELGAETIPCDVVRCSDAEAAMFEIDGNLAGADMSTLDEAYFLARRREAVQKLHPEMKQGMAGAAARWFELNFSSLALSIAEKRGITPRQVYKIMAAGSKLDPRDYQLLRRAPKPIALSDLIEIGKIEETVERYDVVGALSAGTVKSAKAARKAYRAARGEAPAAASPKDATLARLLDAWDRAGKGARMAFLEERGAEVAALFSELEQGGAA
ncbi:ParB N-terminal domain-containing protein [Roseovarius sp. MS2]|uniref:ParB N-terminal domain-containing protein n=1 Tax=Roseovarius sp. MS2 TaxID=3390728 RepID=UPI003EDC7204